MNKSFSFETIQDFDSHIRKSIPDYERLIENILKISDFFISTDTTVYDLGTSTGSFLRLLKSKAKTKGVRYVGIENAQNFFRYHTDEDICWVHEDVTKFDDWSRASFVTNIFTTQFIEPAKRKNLLKKIYNIMTPGSGMVFCEKIYSSSPLLQNINTFLHYDWKNQFFSNDEILEKERSLRSMMKLRQKAEVEEEFNETGWSFYETFWQQNNFVAWIVLK